MRKDVSNGAYAVKHFAPVQNIVALKFNLQGDGVSKNIYENLQMLMDIFAAASSQPPNIDEENFEKFRRKAKI